MTVHFAAARSIALSPVARILARRTAGLAANDNGELLGTDHLIHAALRHFAKHGLNAAAEAQKLAENAFFAGDRIGYDHWLGICRTLDRRMADALEKRRHLR